MRRTLVMLLAGGGGTRLNVLAKARAKPAVPFAGMYRIIDFAMSNVMNSDVNRVAVLTQYKPLSLNDHIGQGEAWDLSGRMRGAKILPPRTGEAASDWYKGTADAIRQNFDLIDQINPERILILSGDHIYFMNYNRLVNFHTESDADVTIAMMRVPWEDTNHFGIASVDDRNRITAWEEKPVEAKSNLASLGIYVFNTAYLKRMLRETGENDFGHGIIPAALREKSVFAYPYVGYWKDVGTLQAYWDASMDLIRPDSGVDLARWRVRTNLEMDSRVGDRPPTLITHDAEVKNSIVSPGCHIEGSVVRSILSPGVRVARGARVVDSIVMHDCAIEQDVLVDRAILDKEVTVGRATIIGHGEEGIPNAETPDHLHTGLTLIGKKATIPAGVKLGRNSIVDAWVRADAFPKGEIPAGSTIR